MHVLINLSWACQLECPYCLLPHIKINREAKVHGWMDWAKALISNVPAGSVVDIAGGDPLLYPDLAALVYVLGQAGIYWAITTNAMHTKAVDELIAAKPTKCALINVSDHPGNGSEEVSENIVKLRTHFPLVINRVDTPDAGHHRDGVSSIIPYQSWREGTELDGITRICDSGQRHWVADPAGDVFRCNPDMARAYPPIGNLFEEDKIIKPAKVTCRSGCSTCYTSVPTAWPVEMKPV